MSRRDQSDILSGIICERAKVGTEASFAGRVYRWMLKRGLAEL